MSAAPERLAAVLALLALVAALVVSVLVTTPWHAGEPGPSADRVMASPSRDFTAAERAAASRYHHQLRIPTYLALGAGLATLALLGLTRWGPALVVAVSRPFGGGWVVQVLLGGLAVLVVARVVALPFDARAEAVRRAFGLSTRTWGAWAVDVAKGFAVTTVLTLLAILAVVALARMMPRWWWLPASAAAATLVVVVSFAYPLVVEPLFNKFTPMAASELRTSLVRMAERDGQQVDEVLVADASRRTTALNAYVSGFGGSRRIVVYDTLLEGASPSEVRLVVAHELGHAKRHDVLHGTLLGALGAAIVVCAVFLVLTWQPLLRRAGAESVGDPRVVALLLFIATLAALVSSPGQALVSRRIEARADVHALALTGDVEAFARMQRRLATTNLSDLQPNPVEYVLFASHPSAPERIALARSWALAHERRPPADLTQ